MTIDSKGNKITTNTDEGGKDNSREWEKRQRRHMGHMRRQSLVWKEAPEVYKDVRDVADDLVAAGAVERMGWCWGRVSYKVRKG